MANNLSKSKFVLFFLLILLSYSLVWSTCQCPSELLGNLRPINNRFSWGIELANSYYFVKSDVIKHYFFPKINSALIYTAPLNLSFLINPVVKYRPSNTISCPRRIAKTGVIFGIWQGFAEFQNDQWQIKLGRLHYKNGLGYIFDIRMDGITVNRTWNSYNGQIFMGTVATDIGQNGFFCQRDLLLEERLCIRQLCNANYGENSLIAFSFGARKYQITFARQFARYNIYNEYIITGIINQGITKNLSLISELAPRFEITNSRIYYTTISYLDYRTNLLRTKFGALLSNKGVLLGMVGLGERMRYGPIDNKVGFLQMTILPNQPTNFQVNYYHRFDKQYQNQNSELDFGIIVRQFLRTQIFLIGTVIDLLDTMPILQANLEVRYVL